jgi:2-iminobutanoate/2-iminopropanoate deaminase
VRETQAEDAQQGAGQGALLSDGRNITVADREVIRIPELDRKLKAMGVPLSAAVRSGDLLFVSGMPPLDFETGQLVTGDVAQQTRKVMENLKRVLEAGGSSLSQVIKTTIYCTGAEHYKAVNAVYAEYFPTDPPARTFVPCTQFDFPFLLEIECVARVGQG